MIRILPIFLFLLLPTLLRSQQMPYTVLQEIRSSGTEIEKQTGFVFEMTIKAGDPARDKDLKLELVSGGKRIAVERAEDGTPKLPELPKEQWAEAYLEHNLGKGNATLGWAMKFKTKAGGDEELPLAGFVEKTFQPIRNLDREVWAPMLRFFGPDVQEHGLLIDVKGVVVGRKEAGKQGAGRLFLERIADKKEVASLDLDPGARMPAKAIWLFEDYDPARHRLAKEGVESDFLFNFVMELGDPNRKPAKSTRRFRVFEGEKKPVVPRPAVPAPKKVEA